MSEAARQSLFDAAAAAQRAGDWRGLERAARDILATDDTSALGHYYLGLSHFLRGDGRTASQSYDTALRLGTQYGDRFSILRATIGLAAVAGEIDLDTETLLRLSEDALRMARELGDDRLTAVALGNIAEACRLLGDYRRALETASEAAALFVRLERWSSAGAQFATIAHVHAMRREFARAIEDMHSAWSYLDREPVAFHRAWYFQVWLLIAAALGQWETFARLYGFVTHYRDVNDAPRLQGMLPWLSQPIEQHYRELGYARASDLASEGEAYTIEQVHELTGRLLP